MKYNLCTAVRDHRGDPMKEGEMPLTLGLVLERACIHGGEPDAKADVKFRQYKLAQKIAASSHITADPVEFSAEQVAALKKLCAQVYTPVAYGAVADMLENEQVISPIDELRAIKAGGTE
jgi:hypothetical protein